MHPNAIVRIMKPHISIDLNYLRQPSKVIKSSLCFYQMVAVLGCQRLTYRDVPPLDNNRFSKLDWLVFDMGFRFFIALFYIKQAKPLKPLESTTPLNVHTHPT